MIVEPWELAPFEPAARAACLLLREDPDDHGEADFGNGPRWAPHWCRVAVEMRRLSVLREAMQSHGWPA